ncbi:hypothetical protein HNR17_000007 [Galbitalea soli]|nr:hypothetical protein [Galbitalea soli]
MTMLISLAALTVWAVLATAHAIATDDYHRLPAR